MSINSVPHHLSLSNETSSSPETLMVNTTQTLQQLPSSNEQSIQLEELPMYVNSEPQQVPPCIEEPVSLGASAMPYTPSLQQLSTHNVQQSLHLDQPSTSAVGLNPQNSSLASKQVLVKDQSPKLQNVMHSSTRPLQQVSTQRQVDEMKSLPHNHDSMFHNLGPQQQTKSKKTTHGEPWPKIISARPVNAGFHLLPSTQKGTGQLEQSSKTKKSSGNASLQKSSSINKRVTQTAPSPKAQFESFELVRVKMRESLAASLALVYDEKSKSGSEDKNLPSVDGGCTAKLAEMCTQQSDTSYLVSGSMTSNTLGCSSANSNLIQNGSDKHNECEEIQTVQQNSSLKEDEAKKGNFVVTDELLQGNGLCWTPDIDVKKDETRVNHGSVRAKFSSEKDSSINEGLGNKSPQGLAEKIEAELFKLYGGVNKKYKEKGRSLLFNLKDRNNPELRKQVLSGDIAPHRLCSMTAEELASKELSEWRIAKAEELAQMVVLPDSEIDMRRLVKKTHKGEFQVEVEHDDTASVEVTYGGSSLLQTSTKASGDEVQIQAKSNKRKAQVLSKSNGSSDHHGGSSLPVAVGSLENKLTDVPNDKTDYMQDIIMEELKDEEMLEQVPSLDEFMKGLDSEPPFKNLTVNIVQEMAVSNENPSDCLETKCDSDHGNQEAKLDHSSDAWASNQKHQSESSESEVDSALKKSMQQTDSGLCDPVVLSNVKSNEMDLTHQRSQGMLRSGSVPIDSTSHPNTGEYNVEHMWEGLIQLNVSSLVTVLGSHKSGEQTSTKDWPSLLEIKGRVRLDAFEKFLQELPLSRSRAIMIIQFCWKEGSSESGRVSLCETIDSYITDERVGYSEPAPGVEIYFCPPHEKTIQILVKQLPKEHEEIFMSTNDGFIGVVVWRRANVNPIISPRPSSHHKHNSKKQSVSRKQQNTNTNVALKSHSQVDNVSVNQNQLAEKELVDDAPPGFGPPATRDEDDLPEFDYAQSSKKNSGSHTHPPIRPADQMRRLVHKYGLNESKDGTGIGVKTWDEDDEDDDIPEWQPHRNILSRSSPPPPQLYRQPSMERQQTAMLLPPPQQQLHQQPLMHLPNVVPQQLLPVASPIPLPLQPLQPPMAVVPSVPNGHLGWQQQGQWWAQPIQAANGAAQLYNHGGGQAGQANAANGLPGMAMEWRHDVFRNR